MDAYYKYHWKSFALIIWFVHQRSCIVAITILHSADVAKLSRAHDLILGSSDPGIESEIQGSACLDRYTDLFRPYQPSYEASLFLRVPQHGTSNPSRQPDWHGYSVPWPHSRQWLLDRSAVCLKFCFVATQSTRSSRIDCFQFRIRGTHNKASPLSIVTLTFPMTFCSCSTILNLRAPCYVQQI